jgi:microcystin-dependent protein
VAAGSGQALSSALPPGPEQQDAPLSEQEKKLLARLLSDPTLYPVEFRTWLKNWLETGGLELPASSIIGGGSSKRVPLPAGIIIAYAGSTIAPNVYICDGRALSRTDEKLLFEAIGTTWGPGDGSTTFDIPDLRDRALYGIGTVVGLGATDGRLAGSRGGPNHYHDFGQTSNGGGNHNHGVGGSTDSQGDHQHSAPSGGQGFASAVGGTAALGSGGTSRYIVNDYFFGTGTTGAHSHGISGGTDDSGDHDHYVSGPTSGGYDQDKPSFAGVNYVITTGKAA